jgi:DNA processing protein
MCEEITEGLKAYNAMIVSGLAFGIDITAHRKSIEKNIPTVGVMGNGLQRIYPNEHRETARLMCENGGLLTEYPSDHEVEKMHFPMRNRIIAGMCDALVVIETAQHGGSMITAHMGEGYGKDVFAVPGKAGDKSSQGCNYLIKTNKAALIESAEDLAHMMGWVQMDLKKSVQSQLFVELNEKEKEIVKILKNTEGSVLIDTLSYQVQLSHSQMAAILLDLEFKGVIKSLPGKRFTLY